MRRRCHTRRQQIPTQDAITAAATLATTGSGIAGWKWVNSIICHHVLMCVIVIIITIVVIVILLLVVTVKETMGEMVLHVNVLAFVVR